jgi:hypothetical protein
MALYGHTVVWSEEQYEMEVFGFINFGKGKNSLSIFEKFGALSLKLVEN